MSPASSNDFDVTMFLRAQSPLQDMNLDNDLPADGPDVSDEVSEENLHAEMLGGFALDPRLDHLSVSACRFCHRSESQTSSIGSLRTSHDKLQALQKHNSELARKLKEAEKQLASLGYMCLEAELIHRADNDGLLQDLHEKLEDARREIAQKRKEEKDLKGKDRAQMMQIAGVGLNLRL